MFNFLNKIKAHPSNGSSNTKITSNKNKEYNTSYESLRKESGRIVLLNWLNGKPIDLIPPLEFSREDMFNLNWISVKNKLISDKLLRIATPEETLPFLKVKQLKEILRSNNQKISGKKSELVKRIRDNVDEDKYYDTLDQTLITSESGNQLLNKYEKILWAHKRSTECLSKTEEPIDIRVNAVSFMNKIGNGKKKEDDALDNYKNAVIFHIKNNTYRQISIDLRQVALILNEQSKLRESLFYFTASELFELSGMQFYIEGELYANYFDLENVRSFSKTEILNLIYSIPMNLDEYKLVIENVWKEYGKHLPSCSLIRSKQEFINKMTVTLQ
ncbi:SAP domain-containing protein [Fructobacillus tropaeoli]|uniref:SAP domain-containing protein n=1 Tax=Fructobacillus tropaeoli TaxID=709323 RepID=A0ABN9YKJ4_9LACO|nr:hypothetical protein R53137_KAKDMLNK_00263 [Fructobacillus tropaeoli]CAK1234310.1 hypothetical protein LMG30238_FMBOGHMB_00601 [Fructobacillus tropaeoli]